jgi:hypothetical protein
MRSSHGKLTMQIALAMGAVFCLLPTSVRAGAIIAINVTPDSVGSAGPALGLPAQADEPPARPIRFDRIDDDLARGCGAPNEELPRNNGSSHSALACGTNGLTGDAPGGWLRERHGAHVPIPPNFELLKVPRD